MAELYNLTNVSNSGNFFELTKNVNELTGSLWGSMVLFSFFIVLFVGLRGDMKIKSAAASFSTTIVAILFRVMGFVGDWQVYIFIIVTIVTMTFAMYNR